MLEKYAFMAPDCANVSRHTPFHVVLHICTGVDSLYMHRLCAHCIDNAIALSIHL